MSTHEKQTFLATYDWAKSWADLPWAHQEPTLFLAEICDRRKPGRALDIGCGAGTDSVYLAKKGWEVTALDFMPKALEYTTARARDAGVAVTPVEADITEWQVPGSFDLVLDHGLLHNMDPVRYPAYRERVLAALGDEADLVLLHWHPRYPGQPSGRMGPRRASREQILDFFAPELQERWFAREEFEDLPDLVGGGMTQAYYWLRRNRAESRPAELLEQVRATFRRNGVDVDARLAGAGTAAVKAKLAAPDLLARLAGPGRLGISHVPLSPGDAETRLSAWARRAGQEPRAVLNLLTLFAASDAGDLCGAVPKCGQCEVTACKRLRYR
ncbi:MAG: class I SAM-dependent methyltransferase [Gammaproteobacteria bacterium]|jgi:SAM-dependent methyltransferase|nr:class I SAM-dependent methyltransferase [Gammaproteobacteria bacterium]